MPPGSRMTRAELLGLSAIAVILLLHVAAYNFIADDAFIHLRYARNLIEGHGLVFNPGERVEGFTSTLWVLVLAGLGWLGGDLLVCARVLGVLAALCTLLVTYRLLRHYLPAGIAPAWALIAPAMLALNGSFACWAAGGLETPLFVLLAVSGVWSVVERRHLLSAMTLALLCLVRPEGIALAGMLALYQLYDLRGERNWVWIASWLSVAGAVTAQLAFRFSYYGDLLPNSYYAKTGGGLAQIMRGLRYLLEYSGDHEGLPLMIIPALLILLRGGPGLRLICGIAAFLWAAAVWVGGDGLPMYRFSLAPLPFLLVVQGLTLAIAVHWAKSRFDITPAKVWAATLSCLAVWAVVEVSPPKLGPHYELYSFQKVEVPRWRRVGKWFASHASEGDTIAVGPIGAISYDSRLRIYDILGLTDRHIARMHMKTMGQGMAGHEKHDGQYILGRRPTYILLGNVSVTPEPRDPNSKPFIEYGNRDVFAREEDFYEGDALSRMYRPRSFKIGPGEYLNCYEIREEYRPR